jgi:general secretion pathway protein G
MKKKHPLTLLEIIIVIFLITLISGAIGYSMKGTLDKGKVFRTEQAQEQLRDLLLMCVAEGESPENVVHNPVAVLKKYGLAKNPDKIIEDGWGKKFDIVLTSSKNDFKISSEELKKYHKKTKPQSVDLSEEEDSFAF